MRAWISLLRWRLQKLPDDVCLWIGRRLPRRLAYWVLIDQCARATTGEYSNTIVPEVTAMTVVDRVSRGRRWGA